jgi:hypothetical protein
MSDNKGSAGVVFIAAPANPAKVDVNVTGP